MFASHHWPRWGNDNVVAYLRAAARPVPLDPRPDACASPTTATSPPRSPRCSPRRADHYEESHTVGYYGAMVHNVKAVYQRYLSWYDGNPCHLDPHPPVEAGTRYVELAGGADALLASAQAGVRPRRLPLGRRAGQPSRVRRSPPTPRPATLLADAYEQLGYQSESATFRNAYLMGAQELHGGTSAVAPRHS